MTQNDEIYNEADTFTDLYDKLNNKYLNPLVTSNLILAKAIREVFSDGVRSTDNVIQGFFGDEGDDDDRQPSA